jgi:hypothetical protein
MAWSILTSGPYMELLFQLLKPKVDISTGEYVFTAPLASGAIPLIHLEDLGHYALWIFDNPEKSTGLNLEIATEHVGWDYLASTFTAVTGKPARFDDVDPEKFVLPQGNDVKVGYGANQNDPTLLTYKENFGGWFASFRHSGGNTGLITRDYELLDRILPTRVKTVGEWMKKVGYTGEAKPVLKDWADKGMK